jgi:hypothetical protein
VIVNSARTVVLQGLYFLVRIKRDSRLKAVVGVTTNVGIGVKRFLI